MKNFLNYNLANMTYIYSVLVLLSAISSAIGTENKNISSLGLILIAVLVLLMTIIANIVATIDFKTTIQYHLANIYAQLGGINPPPSYLHTQTDKCYTITWEYNGFLIDISFSL